MRQGKLIFMWRFVGFLIGKGQPVFFTRRACRRPCVYRLGRQNCSKSFAKDFLLDPLKFLCARGIFRYMLSDTKGFAFK